MANNTKYILLSLPTSIAPSNDKADALSALSSTIGDNGAVAPFKVPNFKIGTLDALVQQADDLGKLESACEGVVAKVGDTLRTILDGDEAKIGPQKTVNDKPADQYLGNFTWNTVKYRTDKPLRELIDSLQKELLGIDNDVKSKYTQYNSIKTTLAALQRKQTGNLATKSLTPVVDPSLLIQDSEFLETHLVVVPNLAKKDFLRSYETISQMVVPRSAVEVTHDEELTLYTVTVFKKFGAEFVQKCRDQRWTPRDYKYVEGGREEEKKELERVIRDERKVWGEVLRLARTGWSESVMIWIHVLCLRVFVETVLRYGLPLEFVSALVKTNTKQAKKARTSLDSAYSYLGGNAFGRDKKGRVTKDDATLSSEMSALGVGGQGEGNE
ncbi:Vacuolar ATP synthase subunit C [Pseudogymnoascus australis]